MSIRLLVGTLQAKHILVATGSFASKIPIEGAEHAITSDEILNLDVLPEKCITSPELCLHGLPAISHTFECSSLPCNVLKGFSCMSAAMTR